MFTEKITVIVPVYKVEGYLDRCVESIVNQTYKNLEILLIDDGSPDNCPAICDKWAEKDDRIKVIHKQNEGVSKARNTGLDNATGTYIAFVDSDDYIHPETYENLTKVVVDSGCDIAMCGFTAVYEDGKEKPFIERNLLNVNSKNIINHFLANTTEERETVFETYGIMGNVWRLLIKKEVIGDVRFEQLKIAEDLLFLIKIIKDDIKISATDKRCYYYLQRESSVMHTFNKDKVALRYQSFKTILKEIENRVAIDNLNAFKFYNYASLSNEMVKYGHIDLLKEYLSDGFFHTLNTREGYLAEKKNVKSLKRKIAYYLVHKKWFSLYEKLCKLA